jgi:hypothetical protein
MTKHRGSSGNIFLVVLPLNAVGVFTFYELIKVIGFQFKTHLKYLFFYRDTNVSITTVKPRTGVTSANQGQESG